MGKHQARVAIVTGASCGIDVNCICSGGVDTEGVLNVLASRREAPKLMRPEEISALALFLASDAASAITGAALDAFGRTNPIFRETI